MSDCSVFIGGCCSGTGVFLAFLVYVVIRLVISTKEQ